MSSMWPTHSEQEPWFRIGRVEVTSTTLLVGLTAISWLIWVFSGTNSTQWFYFSVDALTSGQVWRLITWPFAGALDLWALLIAVMLWYFGNMLEKSIGRTRMAWLLVGIWASVTLANVVIALLMSSQGVLAGISLIEFAVLLLWIAEYPHARFLFNIPAWIFGLAIVGIQVLQLVAYAMWTALLALVLSMVFIAIAARMSGLLADYAWIPGKPQTHKPKAAKVPRKQAQQQARQASDQERMDALLDQLSQHGFQSLTTAQRKELKKLSDRRRNG